MVSIVKDAPGFRDLKITIGGQSFSSVESISWSDDLEVGEVRGVGGRLVDIVHGRYAARGSITFLLSEEKAFLSAANGGTQGRVTLGNTARHWVVSWAEGTEACILEGVVLSGHRLSHSGSGAMVVSYDFRAARVTTGGIGPAA